VQTEKQAANAQGREQGRAVLLLGSIAAAQGRTASEAQSSKNAENQAGAIPASIGRVHDGPDGVVRVPGKLGDRRHDQANGPGQNARLEPSRLSRVCQQRSDPGKAAGSDAKADGEEPVDRVLDEISREARQGEKVEEALILDNK